MQFTKMHGAGNDYVYVDCFAQPIPDNVEQLARQIADRHCGVGGDGLILICPSERADAEMRMYNADGSYSEMCGNGIRCVAKYLYDHNIAKKETLAIESAGSLLTVEVFTSAGKVNRVRVDMGEPVLNAARIPTLLPGDPVVEVPLNALGTLFRVTSVSMGNPHCVLFVDHPSDELVFRAGPILERHEAFPNRVNVEFVQQLAPDRLKQRTWERGSGETLACGTGASAVCVAGVLTGRTQRKVTIELLGGELELEWNETDNHVYMTGPAEEVFSGEWNQS
ncbi:diaminopimelate epimerase [Aeoliella sp. ICT_H6.2]|uniref:Diaminopimelate epimerase n=1 Tax=Aeoliella straminimaris TaxID=2954799 RepID=A0A9X2FCK5_9BACT|nr:diaminopimelate epimerase [Aeoliella straminimaris]MCO6043521.1 diaminopimelate epimerase [Aeoliella straminimaris]